MAKVVSKKVEQKQKKSAQLLDTKSDYNNYSNLSYFISQYKRAVEIINECETFYSNFLRNKLLSYEQIKETKGINLLSFDFAYNEYKENIFILYKYFIYKTLNAEFKKNNLTLYQYEPCCSEKHDSCGVVIEKKFAGDFKLKAKRGAIIIDEKYLSFLIDGYCFNRYEMSFDKKEHYTYGDKFIDKIYIDEDKQNSYFVLDQKTDSGKIVMSNGKERHFKTIKLERFYFCYDFKKDKSVYTSQHEKDLFAVFGEEELKLIEILKKFHKKHKAVQYDMFVHPSKYINLWNEYVEKYILIEENDSNESQTKIKAKIPGTYYVHHNYRSRRGCVNPHKGMLAPVDYSIGPTGWKSDLYPKNTKSKKTKKAATSRVTGKSLIDSYEDDEYIVGSYSIDAVDFLNFESITCNNQNDSLSNVLYRNRLGYGQSKYESVERRYLKQAKLQHHIESIHPEALNAIDNKIDKWIDKNWYYILIDNTPYQFTNCLNKVKIEYDEDENKLYCKYKNVTRRKKAAWPGWLPWIVTEHLYDLVFDCNTNEPIEYSYGNYEHEEKTTD